MSAQGWDEAAPAWLAHLGEHGDWGRRAVADPALRRFLASRQFDHALDAGCGEGRVCRMLTKQGIRAVGIDPTLPLIEAARDRDPAGCYLPASATALPFDASSFDLVVSCLVLIDVEDAAAAIMEMARVLKPGGSLFVVNLTGICTAGMDLVHPMTPDGRDHFQIDNYLDDRRSVVELGDARVLNRHRPLKRYMRWYLDAGLTLEDFDEPNPEGAEADSDTAARYRRAPWFNVMVWRKPITA